MNYQPPVGREDEEHPMTQTYSTTVDDQPKSNRTRAIIIGIVVVLIVAVVGGWFFLSAANDSPAEAGPADQAPEITVVQPGSGTIEGTINASGTIAARRALPVDARAGGGGPAQAV